MKTLTIRVIYPDGSHAEYEVTQARIYGGAKVSVAFGELVIKPPEAEKDDS